MKKPFNLFVLLVVNLVALSFVWSAADDSTPKKTVLQADGITPVMRDDVTLLGILCGVLVVTAFILVFLFYRNTSISGWYDRYRRRRIDESAMKRQVQDEHDREIWRRGLAPGSPPVRVMRALPGEPIQPLFE